MLLVKPVIVNPANKMKMQITRNWTTQECCDALMNQDVFLRSDT